MSDTNPRRRPMPITERHLEHLRSTLAQTSDHDTRKVIKAAIYEVLENVLAARP